MSDKFQNQYRIPSARASWWDYENDGAYFITICTKGRECFLGKIVAGEMELSGSGKIAHSFWADIPNHFPFVKLDLFIVMPNHIHGIIIIDKTHTVETLHCNVFESGTILSGNNEMLQNNKTLRNNETLRCNVSTERDKQKLLKQQMSDISPRWGSLASVIRSYKSAVTRDAHKTDPHFGWQERYWDHIIRDEESFHRIYNYIKNNPAKWNEDSLFKE